MAKYYRIFFIIAFFLIIGNPSITVADNKNENPFTTFTEFPDRVANITLVGDGDQGSHFRISYTFSGFYVWANRILSGMKNAGMSQALDMISDIYTLYPVASQVSIRGRFNGHSTCKSWVNSINCTKSSSLPDIATFKQLFDDKRLPFIPFHIVLNDRRAAGGECNIEFMGQLGGPGTDRKIPYTFSTDAAGSSMVSDHCRGLSWTGHSFLVNQLACMRYTKQKCKVSSGPSKPEGGRAPHNQGGIWLEFSAPPQKVDNEIDLDNLFLDGKLEQRSFNGEESFKVTLNYHIGLKKEIDVTLEPEDSSEFTWLPSPGEKRGYTLTLNEPGPQEIEKIRFILHSTSSHPGIATNAGNHLRLDECPDCTIRKTIVKKPWQTFLGLNSNGEPQSLYRLYSQYNDCPIDSLEDIFFTDIDNPEFDPGEDAISEKLKYTITQEITSRKEITQNSYQAVITVMDSAATTRLSAEILWGGVWYEAKAIGKTANSDGTRLLIPLDRNHNQIADSWEEGKGVDNPDDDNDNIPAGDHQGDGLTNFEEYRGIYSEGVLTRLWPDYKDLFVYDDSTRFRASLREVQSRYEKQNLTLWILEEDEFRDDLINFNEVEHRNGDQYIIVIMDHHMVPQVAMAAASGLAVHAGPPTRTANTIIIDSSRPDLSWVGEDPNKTSLTTLLGAEDAAGYYTSHYAQTLGHEIGHLQSLPHHGEGEGYRTVKGEKGWVACIGGEHSGALDCFMKYNNATWFVNLDFVPRTALGDLLAGEKLIPYPDPRGAENYFCQSKTGNGCCRDAQEGGACLKLLNGRSF